MISEAQFQNELKGIIENGIREDIGPGDYSSLACIPHSANGKAKLLVKDQGIIAGVAFAKMIFHHVLIQNTYVLMLYCRMRNTKSISTKAKKATVGGWKFPTRPTKD